MRVIPDGAHPGAAHGPGSNRSGPGKQAEAAKSWAADAKGQSPIKYLFRLSMSFKHKMSR